MIDFYKNSYRYKQLMVLLANRRPARRRGTTELRNDAAVNALLRESKPQLY